MVDPNPPIKRNPGRIPMLGWILLAPVAAWIGYTFIGRYGVHSTSQGGSAPGARSPSVGEAPGSAISTPAPSAQP